MRGRHVGVHPSFPIHETERVGVYVEHLPDGGKRLWNAKTLNSGCDKIVDIIDYRDGLIYCPYCDEMCAEEQFLIEG